MTPTILLVVPPTWHESMPGKEYINYAPLEGVSILATKLSGRGIQVSILDLRLSRMKDRWVSQIKQALVSYDLVGISTAIDSFSFLEKVCELKNDLRHTATLIVGGSLATSAAEELMNELPEIDYLFCGESDDTLSSFILEGVKEGPGIWRHEDKRIEKPDKKLDFPDLKMQPDLSFNYWPLQDGTATGILYSTERGCTSHCSFCTNWQRKYRTKPLDKVRRELQLAVDHQNARHVYLADSTFGVDKERTLKVGEILRDLDLSWECMIKPRDATSEFLRELSVRNCDTVRLGVESFSDDTGFQGSKGTTTEMLRNAAICCSDHGMICVFFIILGLAEETEASLEAMVKFFETTPQAVPRARYIIPIPGTSTAAEFRAKYPDMTDREYLQLLSRVDSGNTDFIRNLSNVADRVLVDISKHLYRYMLSRVGIRYVL